MKKLYTILLLSIVFAAASCAQNNSGNTEIKISKIMKTAIFGGGCFWCTEAIFQNVEGVISVTSGYSGGEKENPTYDEVCSGMTGHAEVIKIDYDPQKVDYSDLLYIFFKTHNPTTLNRQGADAGTQYRSVIFYMDDNQKEIADQIIEELDKAKIWKDPIVTEVSPYSNFYEAEKYHQDYYSNNKLQPYCQVVINPKLEKFKKKMLKEL